MNRVILFCLAVSLTGCAARQAMNDITAACTKNGVLSAECAKNHPEYSNLPKTAQQQVAYRRVLEEQVAANKITPAQADYIQQEYEAKLLNQQNAQNAAASQAASNAMATTGAALMIAGSPRPVQPMNTTCNAFMGTMNCRSY